MNLDLSNIEQRQVHQAMVDIDNAIQELQDSIDDVINLVPATKFDRMRAARGSIRDAHWRLDQLFYNDRVREPDVVFNAHVARALALIVQNAQEFDLASDEADPQGMPRPIEIPDHVGRNRTIDGPAS